jgi:hypothetical protein
MQDEPMMGVGQKLFGDRPHKAIFDVSDGLSGGYAESIGDAKDMRVDRYRRFSKGGV